jgi:hypothetical protein
LNSLAPSITSGERYGKATEHNVLVPRDHWLKQLAKDAHHRFPSSISSGAYRRLIFMMLDREIAA